MVNVRAATGSTGAGVLKPPAPVSTGISNKKGGESPPFLIPPDNAITV